MDAKHTPTPWTSDGIGNIYGADGFEVADFASVHLAANYAAMGFDHWAGHEGVAYVERDDATEAANAARAVACVNACEGIADPAKSVRELVAYAASPGGYLVFDPYEEGAICVVADSHDHAWQQAAPMLGEEPGTPLDDTDYVSKRLSSKDAAKFWQESADLREAVYGILRCLRPSPRVTSDRPALDGLGEALDEAARLVDWGHTAPPVRLVEEGDVNDLLNVCESLLGALTGAPFERAELLRTARAVLAKAEPSRFPEAPMPAAVQSPPADVAPVAASDGGLSASKES